MEKVKKLKGNFSDVLVNDFRKLVKEKLGILSTPESFMYMYRRFGVPTYDNKDEYKILYDYNIQHGDIGISVHASYHEFVYFDLFVPKHYFVEFYKNRIKLMKRLIKESLKRDMFFSAYEIIFNKPKYITNKQHEKNWKLIDAEAQLYFSKEDYAYIDSLWGKENNEKKFFDLLWEFSKHLCSKYRESLNNKDREELRHWQPLLTDLPEIRKKALLIINEFKKGVYVRDCPINIKGYESDKNKISYFVKE